LQEHEWYGSFAQLAEDNFKCPHDGLSEKRMLSHYPDLVKELLRERDVAHGATPRNYLVNANTLPAGSHKVMWWMCSEDATHVWVAPVYKRTLRGDGCPYCANKVACPSNDLNRFPEIAKELHPSRNSLLSAAGIIASSSKPVWWLCPCCGSDWQAPVRQRTQQGRGCPNCGHSCCAAYSASSSNAPTAVASVASTPVQIAGNVAKPLKRSTADASASHIELLPSVHEAQFAVRDPKPGTDRVLTSHIELLPSAKKESAKTGNRKKFENANPQKYSRPVKGGCIARVTQNGETCGS
jgi:hypothetical protein